MRKLASTLLAVSMVATMVAGCGGSSDSQTKVASGAVQSEALQEENSSGEAEVVTFWYNNTGDEARTYEEAIAAYNASQSKYKVEGLSVSDTQKLIVAMSSNESPDVIKIQNQTVIQYTKNGLLESLQDYIDRDSYDTGIFSEQSLTANRIDDVLYALPQDAYIIQMYYNKTLLKEAGYQEPPATMEEMYEMAVKATKVDGKGSIEVLGYPLFPYASARQELIYGFGGRWWDEDSKPSPDSPGILDSLNMNVKFREQFGGKALEGFIGTANTNRYTEQDMFFQGKQLFRLDGPWLPTMMSNFNATVDYGITLVPGTQAHPEYRGSSRYETDSIAIPKMAKNKDGAWDFMKWLCGAEGAKMVNLGMGILPAVKTLYEDADILAVPGFAEFIEALKEEKGVQYPEMLDYDEYMNLVNSMLDSVYAGNETPEDAINGLIAQSAGFQ